MNIIHNDDEKKFAYSIEGKEAYIRYRELDNKTLEYYSTYVPNELRGHGVAGKLAKFAADYAKENRLKVVPTCSYVVSFYQRHPEYSS